MRIEEINKWIDEGGSLPQDLTLEEEVHLRKLGWGVRRDWHSYGQKRYEWNFLHRKPHGKCEEWHPNGQKRYEYNFLHGMNHGVFKKWDEGGNLIRDEEYLYGNKIK